MATINLGSIKFKWQGAYNGATSYTADDVVSYNGSSYVCILASTGNLPTNTTYWSIMAQAGTDITSIVGLAQGDLLYYDGSNWVRLGAGTSGQVLQTGGTGANPSWGTVSSDFVKVSSGTITGTPSQIEFKTTALSGALDFSTYKRFQIFIDKLRCGTGNVQMYAQFLNTSGTAISGNYVFGINASFTVDNSTGNQNGTEIQVTRDGIRGSSERSGSMRIDVPDLTEVNIYKALGFIQHNINGDAIPKTYATITSGTNTDTSAFGGFKLYLGSSTFTDGEYQIYGIKG